MLDEPFAQALPKPFRQGLANPSEHNAEPFRIPEPEQEPEQDKDTSPIDPACMQMAEFLKAAIVRNTPDARVPESLVKWASAFRLMRDRDKRDFVQVKAVIEWVTANDFWRPNILSAEKLREKYDTLKGQMERPNRSSSPPQATSKNGFVC